MKTKGQPEYGKTYALTGGAGEKCIMNGNTWEESEVKQCQCGQEIDEWSTYCLECQEKRFQSGEMDSVNVKTMGQF